MALVLRNLDPAQLLDQSLLGLVLIPLQNHHIRNHHMDRAHHMDQIHMGQNARTDQVLLIQDHHGLNHHMAQVHMDQNRHILSRRMDHMDLDMDLAGVEHQEIN